MRASTLVFAPVGPNPAPLIELLWRLAKDAPGETYQVHALVDQSARDYLDHEVLAPGAALDDLRDTLPSNTIVDFVVEEARDASGTLVADDVEPEARTAYVQALWTAARAVIALADARPVVFGLVAGRRRTMTALQSAMFQLLARPQDRLLDVRVTDGRVEGGTGFFFPTQSSKEVFCNRTGARIDPREVQVVLVDLAIPRLAAFVPTSALRTFQGATDAVEAALTRSAPPRVHIDLRKLEATADGEALPLSRTEFVWYAFLCARRRAGDIEVLSSDGALMQTFLRTLVALPWWPELDPSDVLRTIEATGADDCDLLKSARSYARRKLRRFATSRREPCALIVPTWRKQAGKSRDRLPLSPEFIEIVDL